MDGIHDMGGRQGFGKVRYPTPPHDETWEPRVRALLFLGLKNNIFNMDEFRHAIERMVPTHYMTAPYYERWLTAIATLYVEKGVLAAEALHVGIDGMFPLSQAIGTGRQSSLGQPFVIGETVRVKNQYVSGHVRMPGYIRGKQGTIVSKSIPFAFPDAAAHGILDAEEPTYDVRFRSADLWPESSDEAFIHAAVFQSYLERL